MTSRPAAPESETPETDALDLQYGHRKEIFDAYRELARSLERRLSLAQTEIKGHMRVEEELKRDLEEATKYWYIFFEECLKVDDRLGYAQARIAELEKALTGARKHIENRGAFTPHSVAIAAIDTALKSCHARFVRVK